MRAPMLTQSSEVCGMLSSVTSTMLKMMRKMPAMAGVAIGDEGFTLVEIDYSNAENMMAALISADDKLAAACDAEDFHVTTAYAQYTLP